MQKVHGLMQLAEAESLIQRFQDSQLSNILRRIMSRIKDNQNDYIDKQVEERLRRAGEEKNISIRTVYKEYAVF